MSTNFKTQAVENKKTGMVYKNLIHKIKITEVRQIYLITFWITLVLFIGSALLIVINF